MVKSFFRTVVRRLPAAVCLTLAAAAMSPVHGDQLDIVVRGIDSPLRDNVEARTRSFRIAGNARLSGRRLEKIRSDAERRAATALRPFGYYQPAVRGKIHSTGDRAWRLELHVDKGLPILVENYRIEVTGSGAVDKSLQEWKVAWPLTSGAILNQAVWEEQKADALIRAERSGYLGAVFSEHEIELDLVRLRANLTLVLESGPQAVMGNVVFNQAAVLPGVLDHIPRFRNGQPYDGWLLEQFRLDLWRTGYFENIEVVEERRLEETPPRVNLTVNLEPRKPNTYQGSLGFGSDSGFRLQAMWTRHLLSRRGDSLDVGFGWQQKDNEINFRTSYRHPRRASARQYWTADILYKTENQNLKVQPPADPGNLTTVARGDVNDYSFRPGWLRIHDLKRGHQQIFERWYLNYLWENSNFRRAEQPAPELAQAVGPGENLEYRSITSETLSAGVSWDWPVIRGSGFETVGHSHRAWIFTSNSAWGSDIDFTQAYLSTRWTGIRGNRWKFLLRGEVGYSDARVEERSIETDDGPIELSLTELPYAYRFKAGGSQSVRGYGFEDLSDNNIGSNNIVTLSAEIEMLLRESWSVAAFLDAGTAFNDWSAATLRKGVGMGIRWYSIAGPIRLDFARAIDEQGKPWRLHFTIGSPLL
jgi:translocation and assembly module TamA